MTRILNKTVLGHTLYPHTVKINSAWNQAELHCQLEEKQHFFRNLELTESIARLRKVDAITNFSIQ